MKKFALIFMFALIGLTVISGQANFWSGLSDEGNYAMEVDKDHEKAEKKIKDYTAPSSKHPLAQALLSKVANSYNCVLQPSPVLASHTPPPDIAL